MNLHGEPIWYALMTKNLAVAQSFYAGLIGWHVVDAAIPNKPYFVAMQPNGTGGVVAIGGMMPLTEDVFTAGTPAIWLPYFGVNDVDAAVAIVEAHGGNVQTPAMDVPNVGRLALVAHPHVGTFYVMRGTSPEPSQAFAAHEALVGHVAWNELASSDPTAAKACLHEVFGFEVNDAMDMGELGLYEFLSIESGAFAVGAVMPLMEGMPGSMWTTYFRVADIDVGADFVTANGGQVVAGPMEIPGGEYSFNAIDPDGAMFGCVGPRVNGEHKA